MHARQAAFAAILFLAVAACGNSTPGRRIVVADGARTNASSPTPLPTPTCHLVNDNQPDPACTPGVRSALVSLGTLAQTVCSASWVTSRQLDPGQQETLGRNVTAMYGAFSDIEQYAVVPLIPTELGGDPTALENLYPLPLASYYGVTAKVRVDDALNKRLCLPVGDPNHLGLSDAQGLEIHDWTLQADSLAAKVGG